MIVWNTCLGSSGMHLLLGAPNIDGRRSRSITARNHEVEARVPCFTRALQGCTWWAAALSTLDQLRGDQPSGQSHVANTAALGAEVGYHPAWALDEVPSGPGVYIRHIVLTDRGRAGEQIRKRECFRRCVLLRDISRCCRPERQVELAAVRVRACMQSVRDLHGSTGTI